MSQVIGQVWREVVGCRNWPVMQVPQFIALRRNVPLQRTSNAETVSMSWCLLWIGSLHGQVAMLTRTKGDNTAGFCHIAVLCLPILISDTLILVLSLQSFPMNWCGTWYTAHCTQIKYPAVRHGKNESWAMGYLLCIYWLVCHITTGHHWTKGRKEHCSILAILYQLRTLMPEADISGWDR